jgi:transposase-like protein
MFKREIKEKIVQEYLNSGKTLQVLGEQYGVSAVSISKWVRATQPSKVQKSRKRREPVLPPLPIEVKALQEELRKAQLHNKLLNAMLDIGKEEYGLDLRKKPGTKQS